MAKGRKRAKLQKRKPREQRGLPSPGLKPSRTQVVVDALAVVAALARIVFGG
jgi:hypothetical protein